MNFSSFLSIFVVATGMNPTYILLSFNPFQSPHH